MQAASEIVRIAAHGAAAPCNRLLVADRQLAFVRFARLMAQRMGYEAEVVLDSRDLSARVTAWRPDVLLIEIVLPQLDGIEIIADLTKAGFKGDLILATAHEAAYLDLARKTAEANGLTVAACLLKPVRAAEMMEALESAAHRMRLDDARQVERTQTLATTRPTVSPSR